MIEWLSSLLHQIDDVEGIIRSGGGARALGENVASGYRHRRR